MELAPDITPEELQVFLQEADEQLQLLDEDLVRLEQEHDNEELVQEIFRAAHTLKGSSAMLGYTPMTELAHAMENLLDKFRKGTLTPSTPVFDALLLSLDALRDLRETLESPDAAPTDITTVVRELDKVAREKSQESAEVPPDGEGTTASLQPALEISSEAKERLEAAITSGKKPLSVKVALSVGPPWSAMRCFQILQETSGLGDVITSSPSAKAIEEGVTASDLELVLATSAEEDEVRRVVASVIDVERVDVTPLEERAKVESDLTRSKDLGAAASDRELRTVRIDVARLDNLMNLVGELVIERTRISQIGKILEARYREDDLVHSLGVTTSNVVKVVNELQEDIMQVRMLPIGRVFNGLPRVARDVAQKLGKKLDLTMDGQETEIDRSLAERIRDPLVHMLRNAVDHGIETPELRISRGKPDKGTVKLDARHEQSHIVITLEDAGGGIDPEVMKAVALKRDVITQELARHWELHGRPQGPGRSSARYPRRNPCRFSPDPAHAGWVYQVIVRTPGQGVGDQGARGQARRFSGARPGSAGPWWLSPDRGQRTGGADRGPSRTRSASIGGLHHGVDRKRVRKVYRGSRPHGHGVRRY